MIAESFYVMRLLLIWALVNDPFSLTVIPGNGSFVSGDQIKITINITNISDDEIVLIDTGGYCDYSILVTYADGTNVPETDFKRSLRCNGPLIYNTDSNDSNRSSNRHGEAKGGITGKRSLVRLKAHESKQQELDVGILYDMRQPGNYVVQVRREIPKGLGTGIVTS